MQDKNLDKILEIIYSVLGCTETLDTETDKDLCQCGLDSILFIKIIILIEEFFDIDIPDDYLIISRLDTVDKIAKLVTELLNE